MGEELKKFAIIAFKALPLWLRALVPDSLGWKLRNWLLDTGDDAARKAAFSKKLIETFKVTETKEALDAINWFHTIDLGHGVLTPGAENSQAKLERIGIPKCLEKKTVLDIGAWDGFFSFEAERRGAKRILAVDSYCWNGQGPGSKKGFDLIWKIKKSKVEDLHLDVMEISPETVGRFDLVLFLGVFYHLKTPIRALERVCSVTAGQLILETEVIFTRTKNPQMFLFPDGYRGDPSNWWVPNPEAILAMLTTFGFKKVVQYEKGTVWNYGRAGRAVFHAWRNESE